MKLRIRYSKLGKVRFVGNLDVLRIWERALRKASLPVAYSTGFSPRPRLSFGLALPMAAESVAEYLDVELTTDCELHGLAERLTATLPSGFTVLAAVEKHPGQASLQEAVVACDWEFDLGPVELDEVRRAVRALLDKTSVPLERERKGERRTDDVRPLVEQLDVAATEAPDGVRLTARLATVGRGLRPTELAAVLLADHPDAAALVRRVVRIEQWIDGDGARRELLPLLAAVAAPADPAGVEEGTRTWTTSRT